MASSVVMPKLSDTMEEGRIIRWLKKEGDPVETGPDARRGGNRQGHRRDGGLYLSGVVRKLVAAEGDTIKIGGLIGVIGAPDEDISALLADQPSAPGAAASRRPPGAALRGRSPPAAAAPARGARPAARSGPSPLALRMAAESGRQPGHAGRQRPTGPDHQAGHRSRPRGGSRGVARARVRGRCEAAIVGSGRGARTPADVQDVDLSTIRRTIAKRLVQSKGPIPHFYLTVDVAMEPCGRRTRRSATSSRRSRSTTSSSRRRRLALRRAPRDQRIVCRRPSEAVQPRAHRPGCRARRRADHAGYARCRPERRSRRFPHEARVLVERARATSCSRTSTPAPPSRSRTSA